MLKSIQRGTDLPSVPIPVQQFLSNLNRFQALNLFQAYPHFTMQAVHFIINESNKKCKRHPLITLIL